jgi:hypothetical protein
MKSSLALLVMLAKSDNLWSSLDGNNEDR